MFNKEVKLNIRAKNDFSLRRTYIKTETEDFCFREIENQRTEALMNVGTGYVKSLIQGELFVGQYRATTKEYEETKEPFYFVLTNFALFRFHPEDCDIPVG